MRQQALLLLSARSPLCGTNRHGTSMAAPHQQLSPDVREPERAALSEQSADKGECPSSGWRSASAAPLFLSPLKSSQTDDEDRRAPHDDDEELPITCSLREECQEAAALLLNNVTPHAVIGTPSPAWWTCGISHVQRLVSSKIPVLQRPADYEAEKRDHQRGSMSSTQALDSLLYSHPYFTVSIGDGETKQKSAVEASAGGGADKSVSKSPGDVSINGGMDWRRGRVGSSSRRRRRIEAVAIDIAVARRSPFL